MAPGSRRRGAASTRRAVRDTVDASRPIYAVKADLFRVLGHPVRVRIIELLRDGERSVGSLQGSLGLDSSGTSQHLALLRRHGLVAGRRDGTTVYYRITEGAVFDLLEAARSVLGRVLDRRRAELDDLVGSLAAPGGADVGYGE